MSKFCAFLLMPTIEAWGPRHVLLVRKENEEGLAVDPELLQRLRDRIDETYGYDVIPVDMHVITDPKTFEAQVKKLVPKRKRT